MEIIHSPSAHSACTHHWSPIAHQIPSVFKHRVLNVCSVFIQHSLHIRSLFMHSLFKSENKMFQGLKWPEWIACILNYYWMNVLIPGLLVCGIFFENQSLQADDIVKKVSKYPLQNQVKTFMIIQISVSRIFIHQ